MIEHKDYHRIQKHLQTLGLEYIQPRFRGGDGYWILPQTCVDGKYCPFAVMVRPKGWDHEVWIRVCQKYFAVSAEDLIAIDQEKLNALIDRANDSEFQIAKVHRTTVEVVTKIMDRCLPMD